MTASSLECRVCHTKVMDSTGFSSSYSIKYLFEWLYKLQAALVTPTSPSHPSSL